MARMKNVTMVSSRVHVLLERLYGLLFQDWGRVWRVRLAFLLLGLLAISGGLTLLAFSDRSPFSSDASSVIWLLNIDLVILLALCALLARRVVALWSGRKQGLLGSDLHVRLVFTFSLLAAIPAITMTIFSAFFFQYGLQSWFSSRVESAIDHSGAVATAYLEEHKQSVAADAQLMAANLERWLLDGDHSDMRGFESFVRKQSFLYDLPEAVVSDTDGQIYARSGDENMLEQEPIPTRALKNALTDEIVLLTGDGEKLVRVLVRLRPFKNRFLYAGRLLDAEVLSYLQATQDATDDYGQLRDRSGALQISIMLMFVVLGLLLVMGAIWMGLVLSRQLIVPISSLLGATEQMRSGDYNARVSEGGRLEEFDALAQGFNKMAEYIQKQQEELLEVNFALDERRRFSETVLRGVSSGVLGLDAKGVVHLANAAAYKLLCGDAQSDVLIGMNLDDILPGASELLVQAAEVPQKIFKQELQVQKESCGTRHYLVRIAVEPLVEGEYGAILTLEDLTDMHRAQRQAAWADVARRIAHEIKNPLTPIQLAAERLRRKYKSQIVEGADVFEQCTDTIVHHVENIGAMVNEFADFARMPEPTMSVLSLASIIGESISFNQQAYPHLKTDFRHDHVRGSDKIMADQGQIRQIFQNLFKNAMEAMDQGHVLDPQVQIDLYSDVKIEGYGDADLVLVFQDNGPGYPEGYDAGQLLEPYVTVKDGGTGLGLAIVKKIIDDHGGEIILGAPSWLDGYKGWSSLGGACSVLIFQKGDIDKIGLGESS